MKSIVITGATSTIGLAMIDCCIEQNIEVLALVNPSSSKLSRIPNSSLVHVLLCGLDELSALDVAEKGEYDAFIHLAWLATAGDEERNQLKMQAMNIQYCLDAVDLAERLGCQTFLGAGSQAEYGRKKEKLTEETVPCPETAYGIAKLCAGQMVRLACRQKGIRCVWPRILSTYGPGSQAQTVINYTITELLAGHSPELTNGEQVWDFLYVKDAAKALLLLAEKGRDGEVYLVGQGDSDYLIQYLKRVRQIVREFIGKEPPELGIGKKNYSEQTVMFLECDISKLVRDTGFCPGVSFEEGIKATIQWIQSEKI